MRRSSSVVGVRNWKRAVSARVWALCALVFTYVRLQAMAVCVQLRVWKRMPHLHECASVCSSPGRLWALIHQITGFRLLVGKKFYNHLLCDNVSVTQVKHSRDLSGLCCVRVWGFLLALAPCTDCCAFLCAWCGSAADVRVNCNSATLRRWNADSEGWRWSESQMFALRCVLREWRRRHHPESNTPRNTWKQSFVQRSRNSEANIFLTWMFLNPISKATAPQRAVCLTQAKHNILCSLLPSLPVNRATLCGGGAGAWQLILVIEWKCVVFQPHVTQFSSINPVPLVFSCPVIMFPWAPDVTHLSSFLCCTFFAHFSQSFYTWTSGPFPHQISAFYIQQPSL